MRLLIGRAASPSLGGVANLYPSTKHQASSTKHQASSTKNQASTNSIVLCPCVLCPCAVILNNSWPAHCPQPVARCPLPRPPPTAPHLPHLHNTITSIFCRQRPSSPPPHLFVTRLLPPPAPANPYPSGCCRYWRQCIRCCQLPSSLTYFHSKRAFRGGRPEASGIDTSSIHAHVASTPASSATPSTARCCHRPLVAHNGTLWLLPSLHQPSCFADLDSSSSFV